MKICVIGTGYVGLSLAVLLSQKHEVIAYDISEEKVALINKRKSPIKDKVLEKFLRKKLNLRATLEKQEAISEADQVVIATPTNYDLNTGSFDTSSVEQAISDSLRINPSSLIVIKSTIPFGFTDKMRDKFDCNNIIFSPEFLRESMALYDSLNPSRIVIGGRSDRAIQFGEMLLDCSLKTRDEVHFLIMDSKEAEAVKLFSNTYLAMRISFFNELDSFAETHNLSSKKIIEGVSSDPRIGNHYNNPSFGYGGYCLPKDTKQLLENFNGIQNNIITAVVEANKTRKEFITESIINKSPETVGVYRLVMKEGSDNFRESAVLDILENLKRNKANVILYEPFFKEKYFRGFEVVDDLDSFILQSDLIIANRLSNELDHVKDKIYSRDLFHEN